MIEVNKSAFTAFAVDEDIVCPGCITDGEVGHMQPSGIQSQDDLEKQFPNKKLVCCRCGKRIGGAKRGRKPRQVSSE
jgi:hypothetical protein